MKKIFIVIILTFTVNFVLYGQTYSSYIRFGQNLNVDQTEYYTWVKNRRIQLFWDYRLKKYCYIQSNKSNKWRKVYINRPKFKKHNHHKIQIILND